VLKIIRDKDGNHTVDGKPFIPSGVEQYLKTVPTRATRMTEAFSVETLEGTMTGKAGDWLMIGAKDEMYPCDADVFARTYDWVSDS